MLTFKISDYKLDSFIAKAFRRVNLSHETLVVLTIRNALRHITHVRSILLIIIRKTNLKKRKRVSVEARVKYSAMNYGTVSALLLYYI